VAVVGFIAGCGGGEHGAHVTSGRGPSEARPATARLAPATTNTRCDVGGRPGYFVPKPERSPIAIVGCARLGVSAKPVEFSVNGERDGGKRWVCLNAAYRVRGRLGHFIPSVCPREPVSRGVNVSSMEGPREVPGYEKVIWGTAAPSTRRVVASYEGGETEAAVFTVSRTLARAAGATWPFSVFVVELHPEAGCGRVVVLRATGVGGPSTTRFRSRSRSCRE
jgi:hypothetical protein